MDEATFNYINDWPILEVVDMKRYKVQHRITMILRENIWPHYENFLSYYFLSHSLQIW